MAHILLIEDYPSLQEIYRETLEIDKHTVVVAANAEEALELTKHNNFDIVLLDLLLHESFGLDFLANFKAEDHPQTKIIIISNLFTNEILNKAMQLGAKHYLIKSEITPQQLADVVNETLEEAAQTPPNTTSTRPS